VTDLVNWLFSPAPGIQPIGTIDDPSGFIPHVAVCVNHAYRDNDYARIVLADKQFLLAPIGRRARTVIPEHKPKDRRAKEAKIISL